MKRIQLILLFLVCLLNMAWTSSDNPKIEEYMQQGYQAWQAGNLTEAMSYYENALMLKPRDVEILNSLGVVYEEVGVPEKAEEKYLNAIKLDGKFLPAYFNLATLYWNKGDNKKAAYYFQKRVDMGSLRDPWTIQARKALESIKSK